MKLVTRKIANLFRKHPFRSQRRKGENANVLAKYFDPYGTGTWLITEAQQMRDGDWLMYGHFKRYGEWFWGYIKLSDLGRMNDGSYYEVERDLYIPEISTVAELKKMRCGEYVRVQ